MISIYKKFIIHEIRHTNLFFLFSTQNTLSTRSSSGLKLIGIYFQSICNLFQIMLIINSWFVRMDYTLYELRSFSRQYCSTLVSRKENRSMKQTIVSSSSNHAEILAIHEANRECVWLRSIIQHIQEDCGLSTGK